MANNFNFTEQQQQEVILPASVENLINSICDKQKQDQPDLSVRRQLAAIGEQQALYILDIISKSKTIRSLSGYIRYMINNHSPSKPSHSPSSATRPCQDGLSTTHSPAVEHQGCSSQGEENGFSPALVALGELEFRKAFLLLSYIGGESLENAITAEKIRSLKEMPMLTFEKEIWEAIGQKYIECEERQLYVEWDSGRPHVYHCYVSSDGSLRFKGPMLHDTRTHLQKSLGDDNVLVVKFAEERNVRNSRTTFQEADALYGKFGKEWIRVGLRLYRFFVFKDGGKEEKKKDPTTSPVKCYFVRMKSDSFADERASYILSNKTMFEARSLFMHVHMLANLDNLDKYMARFSLILSKTLTLKIDLATVNVETIKDVYCRDENDNIVHDNEEPRIHTDGTGFISEDLAVLCPCNVSEGRDSKNKYIKDMSKAMGEAELSTRQPPLLIQCRLFHMGRAVKGTLLVNRKLPPRTIQVRRSMIKVKADPNLVNIQSINSMEVVATSNKPNRSYLSRYLIALLSYGGVPNEFFMDVLRSNLEEVSHVYSRKRTALKVSVNHGEMDEYIAAGMILSGIPLDEPFLQYHLSKLANEEKKRLRGGKLYVSDCFYLMGTVDPTGCLGRNEVCIIHENGQITGDVLVYRNPGLHFGDIHVMHARYVEELETYVGHSKYAIFFPSVGPRSVADEIAGGDFDGDMYWVSKNPQLLKYFKRSNPWLERTAGSNSVSLEPSVKKPSAFSADELEEADATLKFRCIDFLCFGMRQLLKYFKRSDPWVERTAPSNSVSLDPSVKKPSAFSADELEEELFKLYLKNRFEPSNAVGVAANSWMALMDRLLTLRNGCNKEKQMEHVRENILKLIDIYYEALDAPKKGGRKVVVPKDLAVEVFPHYMERDKSFTSTSVLGVIYDEVNRWQDEDLSGKKITKLTCFDVDIPGSCLKKWQLLYEEYKKDMTNVMTNALDNDSVTKKNKAAGVFKTYKQELYGAPTLEESPKSISDIYNEALAVYHVTYDYAIKINEVKRCGFAWNVAGSALTRFYVVKQNLKALTCAPSVLREIWGS